MSKNVLMTVIAPHPPIIIPEVGGNELKRAEKTVNALKNLSERIVQAEPEIVVVITPHSAFHPELFSTYSEKRLRGDFSRFRAPGIGVEYDNDIEFLSKLDKINALPSGVPLDHGSAVPLYYLKQAGYHNKVIVINYTAQNKQEHKAFGQKIAEVAEILDRKVVVIASGDLSHKLLPTAPAGYDKDAHKFDKLIVEKIQQGDYQAIEDITMNMRQIAGECGYNSIMVALGVVDGKPQNNEVLSYEAPFGVGYVVGIL